MENWMIEVGRQLIEECQCGCGVDVEMLPLLWSCQVAGWQQQRGPVIAPNTRPWNNLHSAHWAYLLHTQHLHHIAQWACSGGKYVSIRILLKHKISVLTLFTVVAVHRCCCPTLLSRVRDSPNSGELVPARWPRWSWELRRPLLSYIPNLWLTVQCSAPSCTTCNLWKHPFRLQTKHWFQSTFTLYNTISSRVFLAVIVGNA